jgi:hypothetical protein
MDNIQYLRIRIRERVDLLNYFTKYQIPFSVDGYKILADELRIMRIELAELEHKLSIFNYNLINSN